MTCPILKRPADCTRPGPSRLSFTPKPRPKQCVRELEIPGLTSTTRTLFSGLRVSTHGKQAGPSVGFYHSAGRQPANSTPRPAGGVGHMKVGDDVITSKADIADVLADTFAEKSSFSNYSAAFQKFKNTKEKTKLNFKSNNNEHYNTDFTLKELRKALKKCHDTAVGCDDIHYQYLKHLPFQSLDSLLQIFNQVWHTGILPDSWKEAIVIPIPKPGKDSTNPASYRPIALTICICKTMERMVNDRLVWFLEKNKLIVTVQSSSHKQRGTLDHLVRFETFIRKAFIKKEHVVSLFFFLESAYATTWERNYERPP